MRQPSRSVIAVAAISLVSLLTAVGGAAAYATPASGVKGDPQPELKPFKIGASNTGGAVAVEPNGSIVVAYQVSSTNGNGADRVCVLDRGKHTCSITTTISSPDDQDLFGNTEVLVPAADDVDVLQNTTTNTYVIRSTNGGASFSSGVAVGEVGVDHATLIGGNIVWVTSGNGIDVQSVSATSPGAPATVAAMNVPGSVDAGIGSYQGGVLVGSDNDESGPTDIEYAPSGDNFNESSSYHSVGHFNGQAEVAMSGNALLTEQTTGKHELEIRFFNGTGFGTAHIVPGTKGCDLGCWVTIDQDSSGVTHFFSETSHSTPLYNLFEYSTANGSHWSGPVNLGDAERNNTFAAGLDSNGSGLVLGTDPAWGYPVLQTQNISFRLKSSSIRKGRSTTGSGTGSPAGVGRKVELQVERSGKWYDVASTTEKTGGKFSFTIKGSSVGTHEYRAVVSDEAGYLRYGYSSGRSLRVTG
jgi:hypothetical protein